MLNSILGSTLTLSGFLICTAVSLVLGLATAGVADKRAPEKAMAAAAITAAGLSVLVNIFFCYSGIEFCGEQSGAQINPRASVALWLQSSIVFQVAANNKGKRRR